MVAQGLEKAYGVLRDRDKPIMCVLALGPSGVGKTLVPKVLADYLFGNPKGLIRVDGQDFSKSHDVARLTGAPPGYVGYGDAPLFTQEKLDKPAFDAEWKKFFSNLSVENKRKFAELNARLRIHRQFLESPSEPAESERIKRDQIEGDVRKIEAEMSAMGVSALYAG